MNSSGLTPKTVLLAEDEESIRALLVQVLQQSGYRVMACADGREALTKSRQFKGAIDLLISDVDMPHTTGIELAKEVQLQRPAIKVLLMSGAGEAPTQLNEDWQLLPKPFKFNLLNETIQGLLENGNHAPQLPIWHRERAS